MIKSDNLKIEKYFSMMKNTNQSESLLVLGGESPAKCMVIGASLKENYSCSGDDKSLFLPRKVGRVAEGGLRTNGCLKSRGKGKPLISIITVVRNAQVCIEKAILSVLSQFYGNVEYIIIDGCSVDGTLDIIKKYDEVIDYWVSEPDDGVYDAMNKGVSVSTGDYILFLGSDDHLFDVIHEVVSLFKDKKISYYGNVILSKCNKVYGGNFHPLKLFRKNIPHQAIFYSRHVFDKLRFNTKYITVADYALNLVVFSDKKLGLKYMPKVVAKYNDEGGLSSTVTDHAFSLDKPGIIRKNYSLLYYVAFMVLRFVFKKNDSV